MGDIKFYQSEVFGSIGITHLYGLSLEQLFQVKWRPLSRFCPRVKLIIGPDGVQFGGAKGEDWRGHKGVLSLQPIDPYFVNYTDLGISDLVEQTLLFKNNDPSGRVSQEAQAGKVDVLKVHRDRIEWPRPDGEGDLLIKDQNGILYLRLGYHSQSPKNLNLNLQDLKEGVYELWEKKKRVETFWLTSERTCPLLMIELDLDRLKDQPLLSLVFKNRQLYWRYHVSFNGQKKVSPANYAIWYNKKRDLFSSSLNSNGALLFTSKAPLPLLFEPSAEVKLQSKKDQWIDIVDRLPLPGAKAISISAEGLLCSDVFCSITTD